MKKKLIKLVSFIIILIVPFAVFFTATELVENQYRNTFISALEDKCERLSNTEGKKIIFVGGSSLPFGLRSDLIEQEIDGYSAVNFGLYATLGTKVMMDLSKINISKGDIVVLAPELNEQTYSLYFNPVAVEEALDGYSSKYRYLSLKDNLSLFYNYYKFAFRKLNFSIHNSAPDPIGIYRRDSFNEYGDIRVERDHNIMVNGVDNNMLVYTDDRLINNEFFEYINDYAEYINKKGAKLYFNYSPTNRLALKSSKSARSNFQNEIQELLNCDVLCDIEDCIIDEGYFYDTNFHLNSSGAIYFTNLIIKNLNRFLNRDVISDGGISVPPAPSLPDGGDNIEIPDVKPDDLTNFRDYKGEINIDYQDYFYYRLVGNSYQITGIKDEYKDIKEIIVPSAYNGKIVTTLAKNAFYGCTELSYIHIGKTIRSLESECFNGCISLAGIYLYELDGNTINPSTTGLLKGCNRNAKIYILQGANYTTGYSWEYYFDKFEFFQK